MPIGTRESILAAPDLVEELVEVPQWGCAVKIRALTLAEQHRVFALSSVNGEVDTLKSTLFTFTAGVVEPHFTDLDHEALMKHNAGAVQLVAGRIADLSRMTPGALEQAAKNSQPTPSRERN